MRREGELTLGDRLFLGWLIVVTVGSVVWWIVWAPEFPAKGVVAGGWIGGAYLLWQSRMSERGR